MALPIFQRNVVDAQGNILPGAQVTVRDEATNNLVTLFSDRAGNTALSNPFFADAQGLAVFYSNPGEYRIDAIGAGGTVTWRYVQVIDTQDITTIGDNFTDIETVADNIQAIIDAPQAATNAANSATSAANSATAASNSADDAATSAASVNAANIVHAPGTGLPNEIQTYFNNTLTSTSTAQALTAAQGKALQDTTVKLTGNQTITGTKTFNGVINGTAVTQSATDTTAGRLLKVGDFGVGVGATIEYSDANDVAGFTHFIRFTSATTNRPASGFWQGYTTGGAGFQVVRVSLVASSASIIPRVFERANRNGTWTDWVEIYSTGNLFTSTTAPGNAPIYACRAWVNFNGTTSPGTIRASGNVSSVTRNGTGDYRVNFSTALPDTVYVTNVTNETRAGENFGHAGVFPGGNLTTGPRVITTNSSGVAIDRAHINVSVFR